MPNTREKLIGKLDCVRFQPYDGVVVYRDEAGKEETLWDVITEAIDTIEKLQAENERLKRAIQEWVDGKCISQKYLLMIGQLQRDIPHNCECCRYARKDGGCKLLPDGDKFSPDYTEGFDRDDCEHWEWRGVQEGDNG